jgi:hypothetical protein
MPYRSFEDSLGTEWQVWDIVPRLNERRVADSTDRRVEIVPIKFADRRREERRMSNIRRTVLRGSYAQGWLCFDSAKEKRRLSPIPSDWTVCSDEKLEAYSNSADRVPGQHRDWDGGDGRNALAEAG